MFGTKLYELHAVMDRVLSPDNVPGAAGLLKEILIAFYIIDEDPELSEFRQAQALEICVLALCLLSPTRRVARGLAPAPEPEARARGRRHGRARDGAHGRREGRQRRGRRRRRHDLIRVSSH